jgi:hypothetical protein
MTFFSNINEVDRLCLFLAISNRLSSSWVVLPCRFLQSFMDPAALHLTFERFSVDYINLITPTH